MECRYCRAWNEEDERRCVRCGRRVHMAAPRSMPETYMGSATAPALEPIQMPEPQHAPDAPDRAPNRFPNVPLSFPPSQASLFRDVSGGPKVIPIPTLTPIRPIDREES